MGDVWRRWRDVPLLLDVLVAAVVTFVVVIGAIGEAHPNPPYTVPAGHVPPTAAYLLVAVAGIALVWRRRRPMPVLAVSLGAVLAYTCFGYVNGAAMLAPAFALYAVAAAERTARSVIASVVTLVTLMSASFAFDPLGPTGGGFVLIPGLVAAPLFLGLAVANRRAYVAAVEERAVQAERTREEEARRQVDAERVRIARELHDVVAHTMATINVQASAAVHVTKERPEQATAALLAIKTASKEGLRELRTILNVLRQADEGEPTQPAPGLAQLDSLVATTASIGLPTTLRIDGERAPLPPAVDLVAYRIVQESLTNAVRHAGQARAEVTLTFEPGQLRVDVVDSGAGPRPGAARNGGHGLAGMRERATALGGTFEAGRAAGSGFHVRAVLPLGMDT